MLSPPCGRAWLALPRCRVLGLGRAAEPPDRRSAAVLAGGARGLGVGGEARGRGGEVVPVAGHEAPAVASGVLLVDVEAQGSRPRARGRLRRAVERGRGLASCGGRSGRLSAL